MILLIFLLYNLIDDAINNNVRVSFKIFIVCPFKFPLKEKEKEGILFVVVFKHWS